LKRFTGYLTIGLTTAALAAAGASANDGHGKPDNRNRCHPAPLMLAGTLANDPAAGDSSFQLNVLKANHQGRLFRKATQPLTVSVDAKTRYLKEKQSSSLDALAQNDRVLVLAKLCRSDLKAARASGTLPSMTARFVLDKGPKPAPDSAAEQGDDGADNNASQDDDPTDSNPSPVENGK
jgi:hypothetical protein